LVQAEAQKGEKVFYFSEIETMLTLFKGSPWSFLVIRSTALFSSRYAPSGLSRLHQERGRANSVATLTANIVASNIVPSVTWLCDTARAYTKRPWHQPQSSREQTTSVASQC
jgi:hypothetical protein